MDRITIVIVIVFSLIFVSYRYKEYIDKKKKKEANTWPLEFNNCPDYWVQDGDKCINVHNLGRKHYSDKSSEFPEKDGAMYFNRGQFVGEDSLINKCRWAKKHNISWEGIDNLSGCH